MSVKKTRIETVLEEEDKYLSESDEKILKEINYSRKQMELDLEQLKEWLKDQHHLPECRLTEKDNFLTNYLTGCKGSLETVKRKLDAYYTLRGKSEVYSNRDPLNEEYRKICDLCYQNILPKLTKNGEILFTSKLATSEIPPNAFCNAMKRMINIGDIALRLAPINKPLIYIVDYDKFTRAHAAIYTPGLIRDTIHIAQNVFPSRIKKIILFNVPSFFDVIVNSLIKPFLSQKLKNRIIVTSGGCEELHKYVDKEVLPKDWQGDYHLSLKEVNDAWNEYETTYRDWFINELSEQTNESKRIDTGSKCLIEDSYFGVQGTLKKLAID
ncbi:hypothetical protein O3M35_005019 [Rhynocoris fuscipes]|uniref:CRAL-TRIO domain-containing protein n=1 Tax=Rhynocoris fuscipes TaxID=488301 RepID=A0AAW1DH42_9HEMI